MYKSNPFAVVSPEELNAEQANELFVEMYSDYPEIIRAGNTMVEGARGCGKSMLIRCSLPDFIMVRENQSFDQLPYLAFALSVKKTSLNLQEFAKLEDSYFPNLINEHFLTLNVMMSAFLLLSETKISIHSDEINQYKKYFKDVYSYYMMVAGATERIKPDYSSPNNFFKSLYKHLVKLNSNFLPYLTGLVTNNQPDYSYNLPLLSFNRFIYPVFKEMMKLPGFPQNKPILIFVDDADNLSETQTKVLNTWLASRTQPSISLKVFSQVGQYKSYLTINNILVESPHDYQAVTISPIYTTKTTKPKYYENAVQILFKRLQIAHYFEDIDIKDKKARDKALRAFFPYYDKQEEGIQQEIEKIKKAQEEKGKRGNRKSDDIRRYATPNYIRQLGGTSKSQSKFRYAGIDNIIHISSGIVRYLLDVCAKMYDTAHSNRDDNRIELITTDIQDRVIREKADFYMFTELPKRGGNEDQGTGEIEITDNPQSKTEKLANLINAMGKTFHDILVSGEKGDPLSGRAERTVFSISLYKPERISKEVFDVLKYGVRLGFLQESYVGSKDGGTRTRMYILNRCFSPIFTLDPTGFHGCLSVNNESLLDAIQTSKRLRDVNDEEGSNMKSMHQVTFEEIE